MNPGSSQCAGLVRDCAIASTAVTAMVMAAGHAETGTVWRAINAVSHILYGDRALAAHRFEPEVSLAGIALNAVSVSAWMVLYRLAFGRTRWPGSLLTGLVGALAAYGIDYYVLPKRFAPGFEECLSPRSVALIYTVLGLCLALQGSVGASE
jgi:hypothetical protein